MSIRALLVLSVVSGSSIAEVDGWRLVACLSCSADPTSSTQIVNSLGQDLFLRLLSSVIVVLSC